MFAKPSVEALEQVVYTTNKEAVIEKVLLSIDNHQYSFKMKVNISKQLYVIFHYQWGLDAPKWR